MTPKAFVKAAEQNGVSVRRLPNDRLFLSGHPVAVEQLGDVFNALTRIEQARICWHYSPVPREGWSPASLLNYLLRDGYDVCEIGGKLRVDPQDECRHSELDAALELHEAAIVKILRAPRQPDWLRTFEPISAE